MDFKFKRLNLQKKSKSKAKKYWPIFFLVGVVFTLYIIWSALSTTSSTSVFNFISKIAPNPLKSTDDRVNVLLLGMAGGKHDGATLTDSIIVASYDFKSNKVLLISIPRDLWVDSAKAKVNAIYEYSLKRGDGLKETEKTIAKIVGFPIHYGVRLDFSGFGSAIDIVGGVEVDVPKTFDDYNYPIEGKEDDLCDYKEEERELKEEEVKNLNLPSPYPSGLWYSSLPTPLTPGKYKILIDPEGKIATDSSKIRFECRFEQLHFEKGITLMDGETALKFVRSRMGSNGEGSDFARSRRQQLVLQAFRAKVLSLETLANPSKIVSLVKTLGDSIETDIPTERFIDFYNLTKKVARVNSLVLGDLGDGKSILITPLASDYGGAYVLIPPNNDFKVVHDFLKEKLSEELKARN